MKAIPQISVIPFTISNNSVTFFVVLFSLTRIYKESHTLVTLDSSPSSKNLVPQSSVCRRLNREVFCKNLGKLLGSVKVKGKRKSNTDSAQSMSELQNLSPVDRISDLPASLLFHILSFLPTKEVIATSILSSRWATLWTHVPYLQFIFLPKYVTSELDKNFEKFKSSVCRVLTLLKAPTVETFQLKCAKDIDPFHVNRWICALLRHGVKELDLSSCGRNRMIQLPHNVFTCKSLVVLKLCCKVFFNCPSYIHLPSLKILHLRSELCEGDDGDSVVKLINGCPILEDLHVMSSMFISIPTLNISIPTLKRLRVDTSFYPKGKTRVDTSGTSSWGKIQMNTSSLDNLVIRDYYPAEYLLEELPNLVQADVAIYDHRRNVENYGDCILKLLRGLYNVKILSFYYMSFGINVSIHDLPLFHNLVNLSLHVDSVDCHLLKTLLENSPNLKVFGINKCPNWRESCWSQPSHVPKCLSSHLETFYLWYFQGKEHELEFVKYILENAQVLVTATVYTCYRDLEENSNLIKKMSMFPRGSKTCELKFY